MTENCINRLIIMLLLLGFNLAVTPAQESGKPLPRDYRSIGLGMPVGEVKDLLSRDPWFTYRGEESVSLLERPGASLIEAGGSLFILRGLFHFEDDKLASIILELNPAAIDWYTVYTNLEEKYKVPLEMNPRKVWWEDGSTRMALERPLTVKYLDLQVFDAVQEDETDRIAWRESARQEFIDEF